MLINCKLLSTKIRGEIKEEISKLKKKPCLAVIKVGNDPASEVYVRNKEKACREVGIESMTYCLEDDMTTERVVNLIQQFNENKNINAILVQLPLPKHIDERKVIEAIDPNKDVDGFTPTNVAKLWLNEPCIEPCTPKGIIAILDSIGFEYEGKDAVVLGRSNIVGMPMAKMLQDRGCTVTICHSKTLDRTVHTSVADLIVSAIGKQKSLDWLDLSYPDENKQVIIDVGINRDENGKLCGDVDKNLYEKNMLYITPVPNGVGIMTVTMLLQNTLELYKQQHKYI